MLPLPWASAAPHGEDFPEPPVPLVGKENPERQPALPALWVTLWEPLL